MPRETVYTFAAGLAVKAEGFSAKPTFKVLGFLFLEDVQGIYSFPIFNNSTTQKQALRDSDRIHHQAGKFPAEGSFPAVFRCVRMSSGDDAVDQFAYQTSVNIAGHIFKGILYDQGPESLHIARESSSSALQQPNFINSAASIGTASLSYPNPFNALMPGTPFLSYLK
ncbi:unnamed protein product [Ilex paraguariensis]|uniref:Uncharacterized protein n=1 Tax=Ilex paraguariensis TaxID=185542 RepID=A0ABC8U638_9AQUA